PEVITPAGTPLMDWRFPSLPPVSPVSTQDDDVITVHITMQGDTIPGDNFYAGSLSTSMPLAISAQYYHYTTDIVIVGVDDNEFVVNEFDLEQNYPNPFNPNTIIKYSIADQSNVTLKVFDVLGNEIAQLVNRNQNTGSYEINFDASSLASGMYIYTLNAGNFTSSKKMILLK
ncbi:MAG: T9SS type A sorting domain-containing protein, partial [Ignavibacteriaceae bacterium]|nr:T9SS type A sorting domain-containing protein [Ignavibacteriaceae bacterium]